jgi:hypothetical protein
MDDRAFHNIDITTRADGSVWAVHTTNDDNDDGYPDGATQVWALNYKSVEDAKRVSGKSRIGISGVIVTVTVEGRVV